MARLDIADVNSAALGTAHRTNIYFELGMMYATGSSVPADLVSAHKWFNLAAMQGDAEAARLRREVALEMSEDEIATAQRAARAFLKGTAAQDLPRRPEGDPRAMCGLRFQ